MQNLTEDLIKKIEYKIKENKIKMKPKVFFILKGLLIFSFISILFLTALYIGNFILLIFHDHEEILNSLNVGPFDFHKFLSFLKVIPGLLISSLFIFIISFYKLIKDHSFVYRKNILYTIFFLILFLIMAVVNIHRFLDRDFNRIRFGEDKNFPLIKYLHNYYRKGHKYRSSSYLNIPSNDTKNFKKESFLKE